jgi:TolA-binding protein
MNCREVRAAFTDLYDGTLTGPSLAAANQHLDDCPDCRHEWAAFRRTIQALQSVGDAEPSPGFAARVIERVETPRWWERLARTLVHPLRVKLPLHAAALVALCLAGVWLLQRSPELQRAKDLRAPVPAELPASAPSPQASVAPPASAEKDESARRPPAAPSPPRPSQLPPPAPAPSAAAKLEAPAAARESRDAVQAPRAQDALPMPSPPPPAAAGPSAEQEQAAPRMLRSAQTPVRLPDRARAPLPTGSGTADEMFSAGATSFAAREYESAIDSLRTFLARYPSDSRAPEARFLLADAYRARARYAEARTELEAFLRQNADNRLAPTASYRYGEVLLLLGDPSGCAVLRDALSRHPNAREAASAREMVSARCP